MFPEDQNTVSSEIAHVFFMLQQHFWLQLKAAVTFVV